MLYRLRHATRQLSSVCYTIIVGFTESLFFNTDMTLQVTRNETGDGVIYFRACLAPELSCDYYKDEICVSYGEDDDLIIVSTEKIS